MKPIKTPLLLLLAFTLAGCKTVVTTTTEVRPSRYAVVEFTRPVSHDSIMAFAARALAEEKLKLQKRDDAGGALMAGPVKIPAANGLAELDATVTITTETTGANTKVRIMAAATLEANQTGGIDARLADLVSRIERRLDVMISH